jgi:hypothetical protein
MSDCYDAYLPVWLQVKVVSELAHVLALPRRQLDSFLGAAGAGLTNREAIVAALRRCGPLQALRDEDLMAVIDASDPIRYHPGEIVAAATPTPCYSFYLVRSGEVMLMSVKAPLPLLPQGAGLGMQDMQRMAQCAVGVLRAGDLYNEKILVSPAGPLSCHLIATSPGTVVISFELNNILKALGGPAGMMQRGPPGRSAPEAAAAAAAAGGAVAAAVQQPGYHNAQNAMKFADLEFRRVVGTGQFGLVRVVRHVRTDEVFALKVMHKAPLVESKQIEHVLNERRILGEAQHPFCVGLVGAYQDPNSLFLLQVRAGSAGRAMGS